MWLRLSFRTEGGSGGEGRCYLEKVVTVTTYAGKEVQVRKSDFFSFLDGLNHCVSVVFTWLVAHTTRLVGSAFDTYHDHGYVHSDVSGYGDDNRNTVSVTTTVPHPHIPTGSNVGIS